MKQIKRFNRIVASVFLFTIMLILANPAHAGRLGANVMGMFPKEVGEFAYVDLKKTRSIKWFQPFEKQIMPERFQQFETLLAGGGIDLESQTDQLAWGMVPPKSPTIASPIPMGEQIIAIALGTYNPTSTEEYFKQLKLIPFHSHNYTLYACGPGASPNDLFFVFFDSNTAAFGHRAALEKVLEIRSGSGESLLNNDQMFSLINEINGNGTLWAVLNPQYSREKIGQLAPELENFPEAAKLMKRMRNLIININNADNSIDGHFQMVCGSPDEANMVQMLLQAGFVYKRYQIKQENPELAELYDGIQMLPAGDRVVLHMSLNQDQIATAIKNNKLTLNL